MYKTIPWTFKTWIANFKDVDLPIGDLAKDVLRDEDFPDNDDFYENLDYIGRKSHYNHQVMDVFKSVWDFYVASAL